METLPCARAVHHRQRGIYFFNPQIARRTDAGLFKRFAI
jgi:hypothetical protein